jgi:ADP-dependent NAD(P)H-hydrate dehydratase / NAD(P)H-hydrate epimerase
MHTLVRPLTYDSLAYLLAARLGDSHKGNYGHALILGGEPGKGGAALMAAEAAARSGCGLVSVATHSGHAATFLSRRPELMVRGVDNNDVINVMMAQASVLVAGPGLGRGAWSLQLLQAALQQAMNLDLPVVLDADALNLLSEGQLSQYLDHRSKWILTPHAGEAARLLNTNSEEIQTNREASIRQLQQSFGGVVVLKGPGSLVCFEHLGRQQVETCSHGNPGMASGGMGDVLSGIIGALLGQGLGLADSARLGVCLHSKAADLCAEAEGERGMLACDLFPYLRTLLNP